MSSMWRSLPSAAALLLLAGAAAAAPAPAAWTPDWQVLRGALRQRLSEAADRGLLPVLDVESSFSPTAMNAPALRAGLERGGVWAVAWSPEDEESRVEGRGWPWWGRRWQEILRGLADDFPGWTLPVPPAGVLVPGGVPREEALRRLREVLDRARAARYPMLGEYFFRHYSSNQDTVAGESHDIAEPIDGDFGRALFSFSQDAGVPFQIHYELEDDLLPPLERMLDRYPAAKVIWCHAGRVRHPERAPRFMRAPAATLGRLLDAHPNLYFDLGGVRADKYPGTGAPVALWWDPATGRLKPDWQRLVVEHPWRFLAALDLGNDRAEEAPYYADQLKALLLELPPETREIVAYKAAWRLIFREDPGLP